MQRESLFFFSFPMWERFIPNVGMFCSQRGNIMDPMMGIICSRIGNVFRDLCRLLNNKGTLFENKCHLSQDLT